MYIDWTRHLSDPKEKDSFEKAIWGSKRVLNRLRSIIAEYLDNQSKSERSLKDFEEPNWAYKQAYRNGYVAALKTLDKLVDLDQQEN